MKPDFVIPGQRVNLRTTVESDIARCERWNRPGWKAREFDAPHLGSSLDRVIAERKEWLAGDRRPPYWRMEIETTDRRHIGSVSIYRFPRDVHMTEAGISIVEDGLWNQGLGTEAFRLWVDYVFPAHNLARLGAATWSGNPRMVRVAERAGFVVEGRIWNGCEVKGRFYDRIKLGMLRSEWEARKNGGPDAGSLGRGGLTRTGPAGSMWSYQEGPYVRRTRQPSRRRHGARNHEFRCGSEQGSEQNRPSARTPPDAGRFLFPPRLPRPWGKSGTLCRGANRFPLRQPV
jgi:RimJ/RimL family protein N-acetyltransferase